jgi:hypothetical protein
MRLVLVTSTAQAVPITGDTLGCATSPSFLFSCSAGTAVDGVGVEFTLTGVNFGSGGSADIALTTASAPEPGTIILMAASLLLVVFWMRSRKSKFVNEVRPGAIRAFFKMSDGGASGRS